ncbi:MAG: response regulator transcription factor [Acidimicrobiales bacterium]
MGSDHAQTQGGAPAQVAPDPRPPVRILVVDDEPVIRQLLAETLGGDGAVVELAGAAEEALSRLATQPFDVALVDLLLPRPTGWRVLEALRGGEGDRPRAVVVSARATPANLTRAFDLGALDVVAKPFDPMELSVRVTEIADLAPDQVDAYRRAARTRLHV